MTAITPTAVPPISYASITVVVLAAGLGQRFIASGGQTHKLQAQLQDKTVLQHVLDVVKQAGLSAHLVTPIPGTNTGMGDSIARGVHATAHSSAWLILPGDMPLVQAQTLRAVAECVQSSSAYDAVQPVWRDRTGHPVAFSARCLAELLALQGEHGARTVLQRLRMQGKVHALAVEDQGVVHDIDTLSDLAIAAQLFAQRTRLQATTVAPTTNLKDTHGCC